MSYILDALRKADRQRLAARVPTLDTIHRPPAPAGRGFWPGAVVALVAVTGLAVVALLGPRAPVNFPAPGREIPREPAVVVPDSGESLVAPPVASSPSPPRPTAKVPVTRGVSGPAPTVERAEDPRPEPVAPAPAALPAGGPPAGTPAGGAAPPVPAPAALPASPGPSPAAPPAATPPVPAPAAAGALAPTPTAPAPAASASPPALSAAFREAVGKLALEVLVYSDQDAERMVFINGRKYVEGQTLEGQLLLERITREGAVLTWEGQRVVLRPKLNPYLRP